ncbi:WD40-repeat-containing domain protein [Lipomyces kononenkoae]|uniref:WD40-repeat-containing domain protein n=1 Tax=Lipomyces kononenkoae TaxID=34357 RepID=A0ACC3T6A7_LIPKO
MSRFATSSAAAPALSDRLSRTTANEDEISLSRRSHGRASRSHPSLFPDNHYNLFSDDTSDSYYRDDNAHDVTGLVRADYIDEDTRQVSTLSRRPRNYNGLDFLAQDDNDDDNDDEDDDDEEDEEEGISDEMFLPHFHEQLLEDPLILNTLEEALTPAGLSLLDQVQLDYFELDAEFRDFLTDMLKNDIIDTDTYYKLSRIRRPPEIMADDAELNEYDLQGIPWPKDTNVAYQARARRLKTYTGYSNVAGSQDNILSTVNRRYTNEDIFRFHCLYTAARPQLVHFQLRNLIAPISKNNVYYSDGTSIKRLDSESGIIHNVLERSKSKSAIGSSIRISTMAASSDFAVAGGFSGQYVYKKLDLAAESTAPTGEGLVTSDLNSITNHADIIASRTNGTPNAVFSCNDGMVRTLDLEINKMTAEHQYPWAINCTATSPNGKMRIVVGDAPESMLVDTTSGEIMSMISGHKDYSFACAWSNDGYTVATGNQDMTCRVYDFRKFREPIHILGAQLGAIRSIRFDDSGKYMSMAEPVDYVHVINTRDFSRGQIIDFWGEISGVGFSPYSSSMDDSLWIGNSDKLVGGIMHFERSKGFLPLEISPLSDLHI